MSKSNKKACIIAVILIIVGMTIFVGAMASAGWDFRKLNTQDYKTNTYEIEKDFEKIKIEVDTSNIEFVLSDNKECSVVCYETEEIRHSVGVENNTLIIKTVDSRKWYEHIGIFIESPKVKIYLPQNEFEAIEIETDTGDISMENLVVNSNIEIETDTGDISVKSITVNNNIEIETDTGDIFANNITVNNKIDISTDTGDASLQYIFCKDLYFESSTADIFLKKVIMSKGVFIETDTGDVVFDECDAEQISVETSTGDVTGTLLTDKIFVTKTSTGDIDVPSTTSGGKCEIKTSTGDIQIDISAK